jgi:hypothetical protein
MFNSMPLPTNTDVYHVFQIGQLSPFMIGLIEANPDWSYQSWTTAQTTINKLPIFMDIYNKNGIHIPRSEVFYRFTSTKDLIVAIKQNSNIPINYGTDSIYFRAYSNAYYNISGNSSLQLFTVGQTFLNTADILTFQNTYNTYVNMPGAIFAYSNGLLVDAIDLINVSVGDSAEFIYDPSIKRVLTISVGNLQSFLSTLDSNEEKYLIQDYLSNNTTINYERDIEIYITAPYNTSKYQGVYYHRNAIDSHRMLTHRDYSISVNYFTELATNFQTLANTISLNTIPLAFPELSTLNLKVYIRNSGYNHSLIFENNRIEELYKLSLPEVTNAMIGLNATITNWQAATLEASAYSAVMQDTLGGLNDLLIQTALGYNAYSLLIGNTPSSVINTSGQLIAPVPIGLQNNYTAYEYDISGHLLGYYSGNPGNTYNVQNTGAVLVEMMYGTYGSAPDVYFGINNIIIPSNCNYRVYQEIATNTWNDITNSNLYSIVNNILIWNSTNLPLNLMIRTDKIILNNILNITPANGVLYFPFTEENTITGVLANNLMPIPMGDLDIFLNGRSLIEDIDYIVNFPEVTIINVSALNQPVNTSVQNILVRWNGFCNTNMSYRTSIDTGFIANNAFSNGNKYDIMDDSVNRIIVGGMYVTKSNLSIVDNMAGIGIGSGYNGLPYTIKKPLIPIQNILNTDILSFNSASEIIDSSISGYLTAFLPKLTEPLSAVIPSKYSVVSPFISDILFYIIANNPTAITQYMSDMDVLDFCHPFETLLKYDPITIANAIDSRFAVIVPYSQNTVIALPLNQYIFMMSVVRLYCNGLINLSAYITLKPL